MWDWIKKNKKKVMFLGIPLVAGIGMTILVLAVPATLFAFAAIPFVGAALGSLLFGASSIILSALIAGAIIAATAAIVTAIVLGSIELHHLIHHKKAPTDDAAHAEPVAAEEQSNPHAEEQNLANHHSSAVNAADFHAEAPTVAGHPLLASVPESEEEQDHHSAPQAEIKTFEVSSDDAAPAKARTPSPVKISEVHGSFYEAPAKALKEHLNDQHDQLLDEEAKSEGTNNSPTSHV